MFNSDKVKNNEVQGYLFLPQWQARGPFFCTCPPIKSPLRAPGAEARPYGALPVERKRSIKTVPLGYYCYKWYQNSTPKGTILRTVKQCSQGYCFGTLFLSEGYRIVHFWITCNFPKELKNLGRLWIAFTELQGDFYMLQIISVDPRQWAFYNTIR